MPSIDQLIDSCPHTGEILETNPSKVCARRGLPVKKLYCLLKQKEVTDRSVGVGQRLGTCERCTLTIERLMGLETVVDGNVPKQEVGTSLIIPTTGRKSLAEVLEAISLQRDHLADVEVIVVIDGGDSEIADQYDFVNVLQIDKPTENCCNPCVAMNVGAKAANGKTLVFLHDDCVPTENSIVDLSEMADGVIAVAEVDGEQGRFFAIEKELFDRVGGFNPDFRFNPGYEDVEFFHRVGVGIEVEPSATAIHIVKPGGRNYDFRKRNNFRRLQQCRALSK